jgi:hypothetical protein
MKSSISFFVLLCLVTAGGFAAGERNTVGGRSLAMGSTSVAQYDLWSLGNNQAGAAWLKGGSAGMSFENRFLLKELMFEQFACAMSWKAGTFGLIVNRFGNDQYNELKAGFSYARKFGKCFSAGIQIGYLRFHLADAYGSKNLVSCEIGLMYRADRHLTIGVQVVNPVPVLITEKPRELLPATICAGLSWKFSDTFLANAEVEKDLLHKPVFRAGTEYHFTKPAFARIGVSANPFAFSFGFGLEFGKLTIDMASGYHQALGFSPAGSVVYSF